MTTVSKGTERKRPRMGLPTRGPMHLSRTVDPDIPCQVASPQSLTPFLRAGPLYHLFRPASQHHWTPSSCLKKSIQVRGRSPPRFSRMIQEYVEVCGDRGLPADDYQELARKLRLGVR